MPTDPPARGGPSEKAVGAARENAWETTRKLCRADPEYTSMCLGDSDSLAFAALAAAHDPALGLDRSVRLWDVVETLRARAIAEELRAARSPSLGAAIIDATADFIEREFGPSQENT